MHLRKFLSSVLFLLIIPGSGINAQQENRTSQAPTGLALEVVSHKAFPPAYTAVPGPVGKPRGAWYARFGRIEGWQLPAGHLPIRAVNILSQLSGEEVVVTVSVLRGVEFHDEETIVGNYELRANDRVSIKELEQFGLEPFRIAVIRVSPPTPSQPLVKSRAKSLEIVAIEPTNSTLPTYKLTLHNLSDKNISAIRFDVFDTGKISLTSMPRGEEGRPLISAGAFYESNQPILIRAHRTPGGYAPDSPRLQETIISTVVFEDGSYEGDLESAAGFKASTLGRKLALTRLLAIFAAIEQMPPDNPDTAAQIKWFRDQVLAAPNRIDESALSKLCEGFPALDQNKKARLRTSADVALHNVRRELLDELEALEKSGSGQSAFRSWLLKSQDRYQTWLSRL